MEVYIQCFKDGMPSGVSRDKIRGAFGQFLTESVPSLWSVRYDDENWCDIAVGARDDESQVHHLCIERPCGDKRLWDSLAAVLKLGTFVLYFPGSASPLVAAESAISHLPPDMIESLGTPLCVQSGDEIVGHIESA